MDSQFVLVDKKTAGTDAYEDVNALRVLGYIPDSHNW